MELQENIVLKGYTTFQIGGAARYFVEVRTEDELREALAFAEHNKYQYFILAGGSNILFADHGYDGLVIHLLFDQCDIQGTQVTVGAGVHLLTFLNTLADAGLGGLEKMAGVPGSVGGAVRGNAGAFGTEISEVIETVDVLNTESGEVEIFTRAQCAYSYRQSIFKKRSELIILGVHMQFTTARTTDINRVMHETIAHRESKHIQNIKSAGSFFMNPRVPQEVQKKFEDDKGVTSRDGRVPAGWLMERVELGTKVVGGVQAGKTHANYFINTGDATAEDVMMLASIAKSRVRDTFGVQLKEEVQIVGF